MITVLVLLKACVLYFFNTIYYLNWIPMGHSPFVTTLASVTKMTSALGWETLEARCQKAHLCMLLKTINVIIKVPFDHYKPQTPTTISTRSSHDMNLSIPSPRTNVYKYSFFPRQSAAGTMPTQAVTSIHLHTFKTALATILGSYPYENFWL